MVARRMTQLVWVPFARLVRHAEDTSDTLILRIGSLQMTQVPVEAVLSESVAELAGIRTSWGYLWSAVSSVIVHLVGAVLLFMCKRVESSSIRLRKLI